MIGSISYTKRSKLMLCKTRRSAFIPVGQAPSLGASLDHTLYSKLEDYLDQALLHKIGYVRVRFGASI
jgi:hypothetical protein